MTRYPTFPQQAGRPAFGSTASVREAAANVDVVATASEFAPVAAKFLSRTADEDAEVVRAKIANWRGVKARNPLLATLADAQIRKLKAKLKAVERAKKIEQEGIGATRQWRALGQGLTITMILVGGAAAVALLRRRSGASA